MSMTALLRISDVEQRLAMGRSSVYRLIEAGVIERVYVGSSPRIVDESVELYIQKLREPINVDTNKGGRFS
jgi:excisionase family DNA binding protein